MTGGVEYTAMLRVDADHPAFAGHFPGRPIVPGVLLIDWALAAIGDAVRAAGLPGIEPGAALLPGEFGALKFLRPVRPGAELQLVFSIAEPAGDSVAAWRIGFRIECEGQPVASGALACARASAAE